MQRNHWVLVGVAAAGGAVCLSTYLYRRYRWNYVSDFVEIGTVSQLNVHPVKSMRGVAVESMDCAKIGGKSGEYQDRHFIMMDAETRKAVIPHQIPEMVAVGAIIQQNVLHLSFGDNNVQLDIGEVIERANLRRVEIYDGTKQDGYDCGEEVADFLSKIFKTETKLRLLHYVDGMYSERDVVPKKEWLLSTPPKRCDPIAYQNNCPYLTICDSSVEDLNSRFPPQKQFDMRRFRPSIQIAGTPPYDEDMWAELKIGNVVFSCYKPCPRCITVNVDPDTGERDGKNQPLSELRKYRQAAGRLRKYYNMKPILGTYMGVINGGTIHVGDRVFARYKSHPF